MSNLIITLTSGVEALRTNSTTRGVRSNVTFKVPGVDDLPAGVAYNAVDRRIFVGGASATNVVLEGWNFLNVEVIFDDTAVIDEVVDCAFGFDDPANAPPLAVIDKEANALIRAMRYCSFFGPGYFGSASGLTCIRGRFFGSGASATSQPIELIERCDFYGLGGDIIKSTWGDGVIQDNYFDTPVGLPQNTNPWSGETTYATGDTVLDATRTFAYRSLADGNQNNALPSGKTSNASWQNLDPHADHINPYVATGTDPLIIRRNYINRDESLRSFDPWTGTSGQRAIGINNGVRTNRNSGSTDLHVGADIRDNIITGQSITNASFPISLGNPDSPAVNYSPNSLVDNRIGPRDGDVAYYDTATTSSSHTISGNTDYTPPATATAGYGGPAVS